MESQLNALRSSVLFKTVELQLKLAPATPSFPIEWPWMEGVPVDASSFTVESQLNAVEPLAFFNAVVSRPQVARVPEVLRVPRNPRNNGGTFNRRFLRSDDLLALVECDGGIFESGGVGDVVDPFLGVCLDERNLKPGGNITTMVWGIVKKGEA